MDEVALRATLLEEEGLREAERLATVDGHAAVDHGEDAIIHGGLEVVNAVSRVELEVGKSTQLAHDLLSAHELLSLVRQQRLVSIEGGNGLLVSEASVVVLDELLAN